MNSTTTSTIILTKENIEVLIKLSQNDNCNFVKNCQECPLHLISNIAMCIKYSKSLATEQLRLIGEEKVFDILL